MGEYKSRYTGQQVDNILGNAAQKSDLYKYATKAEVAEIEDKIPTKVSDLPNDKGYLTEHQDISHLATKEEVEEAISNIPGGGTADLSNYATKEELQEKQDIISDLEDIREGAALGATALQEEQYKGTIISVDTGEGVDEPELDYVTKAEISEVEEMVDDLGSKVDELKYTDVYYFTDKNIVNSTLVEKTGEGYINGSNIDNLIGSKYADYYEIGDEVGKHVFVKAFLAGATRGYINIAVKYKGNIVSKKNTNYGGAKNEVVLLVPRDSTLCISVQKGSEVTKGYTLEDKYKKYTDINYENFRIFNALNGYIIEDSKFTAPDNVSKTSGAISGTNPHITDTITTYGTTVTCQIDGKSRTKLVKVNSDFFGTNANGYSSLAIFKPTGECLYHNNVCGITYILVKDTLVIRTLWGGNNPILVKDTGSKEGFSVEKKLQELETSFENITIKNLIGKRFTTIGDSLSETGKWQSKFEELSGCHYLSDRELGVMVNKGGTTTGPVFTNCGMERVKNLASIKDGVSLDYIIYENVNDHGMIASADTIEGSIDDNPWMQGQKVDYRTEVFASREALDTFLSSNFQTILSNTSSDERKKGGYFVFAHFKDGGKSSFRFSVKQSATAEGDVKLYRNGNLHITIPISTSMSTEDIVELIYNSNFGAGCINIIEPNNSVVVRLGGSGIQYSIDTGTTGAMIEVEEVNEPVLVPRLFTGLISEEWEDAEKWKESVTLCSLYKGLIEYVKTEFPMTKFYWMIPNLYHVSRNSYYVNTDGTFNVTTYRNTHSHLVWERLRKIVFSVCELYNVPVLDVDKNSNISLENIFSFFNENDVHPLDTGYNRWGETVNSLLT